ncbi:2Fe-2S iron-sulfur cluster-binding protein [Alphaproteobacteria bacterium]|jgi:ferredoxin|nr:2Fe-2S iron-sulfur cluster-binding protein [Alphaproteobacteria bacterium]
MPLVRLFHDHDIFEKKLDKNTNLVVQAGIKKFPFPYLKYKCGMGACGTCECFIISGKENISEPTWKEKKILKEKLSLGFRLACQFRILNDVDLKQNS